MASGTVLTLLLRDLGAGKMMIGMLGALEGLAMLLPQFLGNFIFTSRTHLKTHLVHWHMFIIIPFLFVMGLLLYGAVRLPPAVVRWGLLGSWFFFSLAIGTVASPWTDWVGQIFPIRIRGLAVGLMLAASAGAGVLSALWAAKLIVLDPSLTGYARHYLLAGVITGIAMTVFYLVEDPGTHTAAGTAGNWQQLLRSFRASLRDGNFRAYLVVRALGVMGFSMVPFISVHFARADGSGLENSFIVFCGAIQALSVAAMHVTFGLWGDRHGHRQGMLFGLSMQAAALLSVLAAHGRGGCMLTFALTGAAIGSVSVSTYNLNLETCPHNTRVAHLNLTNLLVAVPMVAGPLVSGALAAWFGTRATFAFCATMSLLALALLAARFQEPRRLKRT